MSTKKDHTEHFFDLLEEFDSAMFTTRMRDGSIRSRPMNIAKSERGGSLWFVSGIESAKVDDIVFDDHANCALQGDYKYLSVSGKARIVRDRTKVREMWEESWRTWFPDGPEDPSLVLIEIEMTAGEYWDMKGTNMLEFLFKAGAAYLTNSKMEYDQNDPDKNAEVKLS